jgi:3-hydroxyisobutyrate dehydrogenase
MAETKTRVGFIGLGLMGAGMARNVAKAGFPLTVFNRTRAKAEALAGEVGCAVADTPRAVAEASEVVVTMVSDVPDVEQVYLHQNGIAPAARPGLACADMGTVGADCARRVAAALEAKGALFVDAPVSGGSWGAEQGTLSIMAGGTEAAFAACRPVFEAMGKQIVHCGPVGMGQTTKLVNQIVVALNLEAACEGLAFAKRAGADVEAVLGAVGAGAASSWAWNTLGPRIAGRDFAPGFKIEHQIKDLRLAIEAAEALDLRLPGTRLVLEHLRAVQERVPDGGALGTQALILAFEENP